MRRTLFIGGLAAFLLILLTRQLTKTAAANVVELLSMPWKLTGSNGAAEQFQSINPLALQNASAVQITYDLHGLCILGGDASAIIFDQSGWKFISLANYGQNCQDGSQSVNVPITDFKDMTGQTPLDPNKQLDGPVHSRIWSGSDFNVDILSIALVAGETPVSFSKFRGIANSQVVSGMIKVTYEADQTKTRYVDFYVDNKLQNRDKSPAFYLADETGFDTGLLPNGSHTIKAVAKGKSRHFNSDESVSVIVENSSSTSPAGQTWDIQSVDAMKDTKDAICSQRPTDWINHFNQKAVELGANYVAISQPYDNPACGDAVGYTKTWVNNIRANGLKVWHRHMPLSFEGIYDVPKTVGTDYLIQIKNYILANGDEFENGDIFTPIPEPQNGGISGITYCAEGVCQFSSKEHFNSWLRDAMIVSKEAFAAIGKPDIKVGYFGFDGFVAWGANNPDWNGILEDATVEAMGNITIDHYPELIGTDMNRDILELEARYPGIDIIIGEWGTVTGGDVENTAVNFMNAVKRPNVKGFNYWQFGPSGAGEQLINDDFTNRAQFDEVRLFFQGVR